MAGYTMDEIRAYHRAVSGVMPRFHRTSFQAISDLLHAAFSELNNALIEAARKSNYDGKWN